MRVQDEYRECRLCPRACGVDRVQAEVDGAKGFCGETGRIRVGYVGPHFGEEPPLTGENGSGTIFFSGCTLQCVYCQNHQISWGGMGETVRSDVLLERIQTMVRRHGVHNLNFVTPDHFLPHVRALVTSLKAKKMGLPVVFNLSGYQSLPWLKAAESSVDIYLPDFKYANSRLAGRLSTCRDYPEIALSAISEMVRQKGFLDVFTGGRTLAKKGVLVRHLILPGYVRNSVNVLNALFLEFGRDVPVSLMSQYTPAVHQRDPLLNETVTGQMFDEVYDHALSLGFEHLFVQFPEKDSDGGVELPLWVPDFQKAEPFGAALS